MVRQEPALVRQKPGLVGQQTKRPWADPLAADRQEVERQVVRSSIRNSLEGHKRKHVLFAAAGASFVERRQPTESFGHS